MRAIHAVVVALLLAAGPALAQNAPLQLEWISVEDGLPGTAILDIEQDPAGYLWFATYFGIARYDGLQFEYFRGDPFDPFALPHSAIFSLHDAGTHLWVATESDGLFSFDYELEVFSPVPVPDPVLTGLMHVYEQADGTLWLGTWAKGLFRLGPDGVWTHFRHRPDDPSGLSSDHITRVAEDSSGRLWMLSGNGVNLFDPARDGFRQLLVNENEPRTPTFTTSEFEKYPPAGSMALAEGADGTLWLGTGHGVLHLDHDGQVLKELDEADGLPDPWVHSLLMTEDGTLWVGTLRGPARITTASYQVDKVDIGVHPGKEHMDRFVVSLHLDHSGVLWMGTAGALARVRLASDRFDTIALPFPTAKSIVEDLSGRVWMGSDEGELGFWEPETGASRIVTPPELTRAAAGDLQTMLIDSAGRLTIGTGEAGVFWFTLPSAGQANLTFAGHLTEGTGLGGCCIRGLLEDSDGSLWVAHISGLDHVGPDGSVIRTIRHDPSEPGASLPPGQILHVARDAEGALWVSSWNGVARSLDDGSSFKRYPHFPGDDTSLSHPFAYTVAPDRNGSVWVSTYSALDRWDPDTGHFAQVILDPELPLTSTTCVLAGKDIWASTFSGIGRVDLETGRTVHYGADRGLPAVDFANGTACHLGPSGRVYFSGRNRLFTVDPDHFRDNLTPPRTAISKVSVGNQTYVAGQWPGADRTLSSSENELAFYFAGFHYEEPERLSFSYRLLGPDDEWVDLRNARSVRLSLQPGEYTLEARSKSALGVMSAPATSSFEIRHPWWGRPGFWFAIFLVLGASAGLSYRARVRALARRSELLRRVVRERTAELQAEKDRTARQANRLVDLDRAKSHFFANVSHEFRTPLTLILGPLQDLLDGRRSLEGLSRDAPIMHRSALRLLRLINQILDLSRLEAGALDLRPTRTDLIAFLRGLVLSFSSHAQRQHIRLLFQSSEERCPVLIDRDKLEKVISNLLTNALAFTPSHGKVMVQLNMSDSCSRCEIQVSDTGQGIPHDRLPHVFERFYHVDAAARRASEGAGIGLALARELTELLGGEIAVSSRVGFGTDFVITLPLDPAPSMPPQSQDSQNGTATDAPAIPAAEGRPEDVLAEAAEATVLVVEDNDDMRQYLVNTLGSRFSVLTAADGEEGLRKAHTSAPDLIISDVMMPKLDGFGLCRALKDDAGLESTPVILLTARADADSRLEGLRCRADDYLAKPFRATELLARAENLLKSRERLRDRYEKHVVVEPSGITVTSEEAELLEHVLSVIELHLGDSTFTVDWLADELGVSRRQLERRVHDIADRSPGELIRQMRVQRATQLLRAHAGTVSEVAYMVGFRSPSHFARVFKHLTGESPSAVRAQPVA